MQMFISRGDSVTALLAGFAAEDISSQDPAQLSGFVIRQGLSQGIHDPLYVRVLTFSDGETTVCLVILDLIGTDAELTEKIRQSVSENSSIPAEHVAILATHTHGGACGLESVSVRKRRCGLPGRGSRGGLEGGQTGACQTATCNAESSQGERKLHRKK